MNSWDLDSCPGLLAFFFFFGGAGMTRGRALTLSAAWLQLGGAPLAEQNPAFIPQRRLLSVSEHLFPGWSWRPSQTHAEVTDQSFVLQMKLSSPTSAQT